MTKFSNLNNSIKVAIYVYALSLIGFLATIFLFFQDRMDIPLGLILGGFVCGTLSLISGFLEKKDEQNHSATLSIVMIGVKLIVVVTVAIIIALMYFSWNLPIFNLVSFIAIYTLAAIFNIVLHLSTK